MDFGTSWQGLLVNLAVIALLISLWSYVDDFIERRSYLWQQIFMACLGAGGTVLLMLMPFEVRPGIIADLRTTLVVISGFFGGPYVGIAAGLAGSAYRVWVGGAGMDAGIASLGTATAVGIAGWWLLRGRIPNKKDIFFLSVAAALSNLVGFLFFPADVRIDLLATIGPPVTVLIFASMMLAGLMILQEVNRREVTMRNRTYRAIIDALPDPLNVKDLEGRFIAANPKTAELMQAGAADDLVGRTDFDFYPQETARVFKAEETRALLEQHPVTIEQRVMRHDGSELWLNTLKAPLTDSETGKVVGLITHNRDITDRKTLENQYAESQRRLADAMASMAEGIVMYNGEERLVFCNQRYKELFPKTADIRVPGAFLRDILRASVERGEQVGIPPEEVDQWIEQTIAGLWKPGDQLIRLFDNRWLQARVRPASDGMSLTVITDVTPIKQAEQELAEANAQLAALAAIDGLTELGNRRTFDIRLREQITEHRKARKDLSLMMVDIDHFKAFNDSYGHPAGDDCLRQISKCLKNTLREQDIAARYGGEEMAAILPNTELAGAVATASRFREAVRNLEIAHKGSPEGFVTVSIGVAATRGDRTMTGSDLVRIADGALYAAKKAGRNMVRAAEDSSEQGQK